MNEQSLKLKLRRRIPQIESIFRREIPLKMCDYDYEDGVYDLFNDIKNEVMYEIYTITIGHSSMDDETTEIIEHFLFDTFYEEIVKTYNKRIVECW